MEQLELYRPHFSETLAEKCCDSYATTIAPMTSPQQLHRRDVMRDVMGDVIGDVTRSVHYASYTTS